VDDEIDKSFWGELESESSEEESEEEEEEERDLESGLVTPGETSVSYQILLFSLPGNDSFREDLYFGGIYFLVFPCVIFELRWPIGTKFCTMLRAAL